MFKAIYVKTESNDNYLWCVPTSTNVVEFLKQLMKDEAEYIRDIMVVDSENNDETIDISVFYD